MSVQLWQHQVESEDGLPIRVDLRAPAEQDPKAAVVVCHGFKGFREWGFFPHACEALAAEGFAVLILDFAHNGIGDEPGEFTRLDLFAKNTYSRELSDLARVRAWLSDESPLASQLDGRPTGILAHSRGSVPAIVATAEDPTVQALVIWNGVSRALRFTQRQLDSWEADGRLEFTNARTGQRMGIDYDFVVDAMEQRERFDLRSQLGRSEAALLLIAGTADMAVDREEAEELFAARGESERTRLEWIENATHTFGAVHPFAESTPELDQALELTAGWFQTHLGI